MKNLNVVFMGTPDFAVGVLDELIKNTNVLLVVTQPDKMVGRKREIKFSPIKELAIKNNISVFQPSRIKEDYQDIIDVNPDIIITCAYGQIIPKDLIELPTYGCINVHASLLPKLRGGAPIHKAIINGYKETGITIMYMDTKMDTGDIISSIKTAISLEDTLGTLYDRLKVMGSKLLIDTLPSIIDGVNNRVKQNDEEATYAYNVTREEEKILFNKTSIEVYNQIRGLNPWPLSYFILNDMEIKVISAVIVETDSVFSPGTVISVTKEMIVIKTIDGAIGITEVKPFGKRIMSVKEYLNGVNHNDIINKIVM